MTGNEQEIKVKDATGQGDPDGARKPYSAPRIEAVPLRPEEAVLGACKTPAVSGPAQALCSFPKTCSALKS